MTAARDPEGGVILINVLVILALSSTVVFAMLRLSDTAVSRSQRYGDAGQGAALIAGGEATAIAALRRDMRSAPQVDHPGEAWAQIAQDEVAVEGGTFSLAITDAQGRFNLNNLSRGAPDELQILQRIIAELDLSDTVGLRLLARLADPTPLTSLGELLDAGIGADDVQRLSSLATVLPAPTAININTMPDAMFAVLAGNPVQARLLQGIRARKGQLTQNDLLEAGLILTTQAGVTSSYFTVTTRVTIGATTQARDSLLYRQSGQGRPSDVVVIARQTPPD
jgi:general secretion pathway protein K